MSSIIDAIEAVLVINLKERPDKWENMYTHLCQFFSESKIHRIDGVLGSSLSGYREKPWFTERSKERAVICAGAAGCTLSHKYAIEYAREHRFKKVLILEDDCHLQEVVRLIPSRVMSCLEDDTRGGILYLGCHHVPKVSYRRESYEGRGLFGISGALGAYAYIVDSRAYESLLSYYAEDNEDIWNWIACHKAVDEWLFKEYNQVGAIFSLYPQVVTILPSRSDIAQKDVSYDIDAAYVPDSILTKDEFDRKMRLFLFKESLIRPLDNFRRWLNCRFRGYPGYKRKSKESLH